MNLSKLKLRLVLLISFTVVAVSATYLFIISFLWINSYGVSEASQILFLGIVVFIIFLVFTISSTVLTSVLRHVPDAKQIKSEAHQEKEEAGMDLVSMVAHELRTPLTSVKGYLAVFMEENKGKFDNTQNMFLHRINVAVQQLMGLTENLLSASRIEKGVFAISTQSIDWVANVADVFDEFLERAKDKKINLDFVKPEHHTFFVKVDKVRIEEVLLNLLSNAISYTDANGKVTVSIEQKGQEVITHVKDTGVGIPKSAIPHLFTKFFRVSGKISQGVKGTGLGLYISKAIVEKHGGRIWVESEEGVGSTFSFSLPSASSS